MSSSGSGGDQAPPKLFDHKPRKSQQKQFRGQQNSNGFSSPPGMGTQASAPPPLPPKEPFIRRYKFIWPMLLAVNLGVGAYLFTRTKKKVPVEEKQEASPISVKETTTTAHVAETPVSPPPIADPVIKREPIPEDQQRELLKWILEEKRKIKPTDAKEKQRIDEEKALLKNLIRSKSLPSI